MNADTPQIMPFSSGSSKPAHPLVEALEWASGQGWFPTVGELPQLLAAYARAQFKDAA